jgi:hypothetical protein
MTGIYKKRVYKQDALTNYGAAEYLLKPFSIMEVWRLLETHLEPNGAHASEVQGADPQDVEVFGGTSLRERPLAQVLAELRDSGATGLLFLKGRGRTDIFFVDQGEPVFVRSSESEERLDSLLLRTGRLDKAQVEEARRLLVQSRGHSRMGEILLGLGYLSQEELAAAVQKQLEQLVLRAFRNEDLAFTFVEGDLPSDEDIRIHLDADNLILKGVRAMDPKGALRQHLPSATARLARTSRGLKGIEALHLTAFERQVLELVDGRNNVGQILTIGRLAEVDAARTLFAFQSLGLIEAVEEEEASGPQPAEEEEVPAVEPVEATPLDLPPQGQLDRIPAGRLVAALNAARWTGVLAMERRGVRKWMIVEDGEVVFAGSEEAADRLGAVLVEGGLLKPQEVEALLAEQEGADGKRLGQILVENGKLSLEELHWAVVFQVQRIVTSSLGWEEGSYLLREGKPESTEAITVRLDTRNLLLEAFRRVAPEVARRQLPDAAQVLSLAEGAWERSDRLKLTSEERLVLRALQEGASRNAMERRSLVEGELLARTLHAFLSMGLAVESGGRDPEVPAAPDLVDDLAADAADALEGVETGFDILPAEVPKPAARKREGAEAPAGEMVPRFLYEKLLEERTSLEASLFQARQSLTQAGGQLDALRKAMEALREGLGNGRGSLPADRLNRFLQETLHEVGEVATALQEAVEVLDK